MKSLVLDLGNTNKKVAVFQNGRLVHFEQSGSLTLAKIKPILKRHEPFDSCILASVSIYSAAVRNFLMEKIPFFIEPSATTPLPVTIQYQSRNTLGFDRVAAVVAGTVIFPGQDVLVVNAGTCITYDYINRNQEYQGGAISPGIRLRLNALHTFTGKLPLVSFKDVSILTGRTTEESILSGVLTGATAEIEGIAGRYREKHPDLKIILSGGDHKYFVKRLNISIFAVPNIVIPGLYQILKFNVDQAR
jgi:type III pantothenate kinase